MSLLESHSVRFIRYVRGPKDSLGNSSSVAYATGFPVSASGLFEFASGRSRQGDEGMRSVRDAVLRCPSYFDGRAGDAVEFNGASYLVVGVRDNRQMVSTPHFAYDLQREELGNRVVFNSNDPSRVNSGE